MTSKPTTNGTVAAATPALRRKTAGARLRRLDPKISPYLYVAPFFVIFGVFGIFPLAYTGYVSLTDRNLLSPVANFIGLGRVHAVRVKKLCDCVRRVE